MDTATQTKDPARTGLKIGAALLVVVVLGLLAMLRPWEPQGGAAAAMSMPEKVELVQTLTGNVVSDDELMQLIATTVPHCDDMTAETAAYYEPLANGALAWGERVGLGAEQTGEMSYFASLVACEW